MEWHQSVELISLPFALEAAAPPAFLKYTYVV